MKLLEDLLNCRLNEIKITFAALWLVDNFVATKPVIKSTEERREKGEKNHFTGKQTPPIAENTIGEQAAGGRLGMKLSRSERNFVAGRVALSGPQKKKKKK